MYLHFTKAQALADGDLFGFFARRCLIDPAYHSTISQTNQAPPSMEPVKVMDRLYFLGQNAVRRAGEQNDSTCSEINLACVRARTLSFLAWPRCVSRDR